MTFLEDYEITFILYHIFLPWITIYNLLKSEDFQKTFIFSSQNSEKKINK